MNRRLIITADDYGMCEAVNQAIEACLMAGAVRATCAMTNMPSFGRTVSLREKFPYSSLGIHWTLTEGRPILPPSQLPSLVDPDGRFHSHVQLRRRWIQRRINMTELKAELRAQYQRFCEVAGRPDFWNTHQNFHVWPGLFDVCVALGQELHIPAMRSHRRFTVPRTSTSTSYHLRHPLYWMKGRIIDRWANRVEAQGMLMPDGRIYTPGYGVDKASLEEVMRRLPWRSVKRAVEVIIHPATRVEDMFGALKESRVCEYQMFKDSGLVASLRQLGIEPVGFEGLKNV
jgi:chitin disaccharide deacetylase